MLRSGNTRRRLAAGAGLVPSLGVGATVTTVVAFLTLAFIAPAGATTHPTAGPVTLPATQMTTLISFSPVDGRKAGQVRLLVNGCRRGGQLTASYAHQRGTATLSHQYLGKLTSCRLPTLTSGSITAHWSTALRLALKLTALGTPKVVRHRVAKGCYVTTDTVEYAATGAFTAAIHQAQFGTLVRSRLTASLVRFVLPGCVLSGSAGSLSSLLGGSSGNSPALQALLKGTNLAAAWGDRRSLNAITDKGSPSEVDFTEPAKDGPTPSVTDTFGLTLTGGGDFGPTTLTHATVNFASPVSTGVLIYTAGVGCPATIRATDGTLAGTVRIDDPVLGPITFTGAEMGEAQLSILDSASYECAPKSLL